MSDKEKSLPYQQVLYVQPQDEDEREIDMGRITSLFLERRMFAVKCALGGAAIFLGVSFFMPKTYESITVVQTSASGSAVGGSTAARAMSALSGGSGSMEVDKYIALMKSRTVIEPIVAEMDYKDGLFYNAEEKKARAIANYNKWAEKNLKIESANGTNLISITAMGETPQKAQKIAQAVTDNFLSLQTDLNQKQQSLLVKFLNERIEIAKEEAIEAGRKFSEYQREHGVYAPTEQAKVAVSRMDAFTNSLVDLKTKQEATQAELDTASRQLANLNANSRDYQINDNAAVQDMRQKIANKEVALVTLRSKYTEEHPDIMTAKRELKVMKDKLAEEVNAIIASQTAAMSPQQSELIRKKLNAEVNLKVSQVSEKAINDKYVEEQKKLADFPESVRIYTELQQEAAMKQSIYTKLVNESETAKISAAQDSMDIQIVDPASLPLNDMPATPKKGQNTLIGGVLGLLIAFLRACYSYWLEFKREVKKI